MTTGKVYIVGFGPGDPDLLTIRGLKILQKADIIFHDDLIPLSFLEQFPVKIVYVGKRKGKHSHTQDEINHLLYEATKSYTSIVRLKGGDPFIFGRGGEEVEFLLSQKIAVEIIPGVTAASAAAAFAGIPLTHRGISRALTFLPAHHLGSSPLPLPKEGTIAIYMGASKLKELKEELLLQGKPLSTPVALIHAASLPNQHVNWCTLQNMHEQTTPSPIVVLIGEVVTWVQKNRKT